jgi:hypothetical protein
MKLIAGKIEAIPLPRKTGVLGFNYVFYNHCVLRTDCVKDLGALLYL